MPCDNAHHATHQYRTKIKRMSIMCASRYSGSSRSSTFNSGSRRKLLSCVDSFGGWASRMEQFEMSANHHSDETRELCQEARTHAEVMAMVPEAIASVAPIILL